MQSIEFVFSIEAPVVLGGGVNQKWSHCSRLCSIMNGNSKRATVHE